MCICVQGFGTRFYSSSARYEGEWVENKRSGWGRMSYENGNVYEGEWLKDKPHGQGVLWLGMTFFTKHIKPLVVLSK